MKDPRLYNFTAKREILLEFMQKFGLYFGGARELTNEQKNHNHQSTGKNLPDLQPSKATES